MKRLLLTSFTAFLTTSILAYAQEQNINGVAMLASHNAARQSVSPAAQQPLPNLQWDDALAESASAFAGQCPWGHSGINGVGENIYYSSSTALVSPDAVVGSWVAEQQYFDVYANSCASGKICGHYTQVVWADTTRVGCGAAICDPKINGDWGQVWVCQYQSPGNYVGEAPYIPQ